MSIEAMKQALEALENAWLDASMGKGDVARHTEAIITLRQAIEQAQKQEPVAHCTVRPLRGDEFYPKTEIIWVKGRPVAGPLYTSPPQRQPLTDEQIAKCYETTGHYQTLRPQDRFGVFALARAIEAAHGIKE